MHVQTGTATMAYTAVPLPASPTLTNPDMILPYGEYDTPSPPRGVYRSGSPNEDWDTNPATMQFSIGNSHAHMGLMTPTTPIIYGNGTMLSDIGEVTEAESTPGRKLPGPAERRMLKQQQHQNQTLRSSPTIGYEAVMKRTKTGSHQRKVSIESTSTVTSEAQHGELFKDFDDSASVDDSVFQGDDEESVADSSVADSYVEEVIASETKRLNRPDSSLGKDDDGNSSAALSRRAEQILLNAKKRLNNMEGNLTRARSSLYITPTGSMSSIHSSSPLARSTPSPQNETAIIPALGVPPSKHRQLNTPSDSPMSSPGHTRVFSENSISSPLRTAFPARSASAAARYIGKGGLDSSQPSPPLSSKYTPEAMHEESRAGSRSGFSSSLSKASPPHGNTLEPLTEDDAVPDFEADRASMKSALDHHLGPSGEHRGLTRSASSMQMRDLRDQMQDLKGRLSVLRDRARDDTMKRRSLQSLRTPSPFTAAEQWYAGSKNYGNSPPLSADAGVAQPPWNGEHREEAETKEEEAKEIPLHAPGYANSDVTSVYEDVVETHASDNMTTHEPPIEEEDYDTAGEGEQQQDFEGDFADDYNDEMVNREEADDYESDASQYHDSVATQISHEDREDAFDYEHFFLHSAMGTIRQQRHGRRDSVGSFASEDSVETTRGPPAPSTNRGDERVSLGHFRSESTDSVSTMATFATATEGTGSENGEEDGTDFSVQEVTTPEPEIRTSTPVTAKRTTFGNTISGFPEAIKTSPPVTRRHSTGHDEQQRNASNIHRPSVASFESFASTGTTRSFPLVNKPKIRDPNSSTPDLRSKDQEPSLLSDSTTLTEGNSERLQPSPVHMLAREDQILVERLVASLGKCVLGLQEAGRASYEGRVWRRRLDAARRVLEGQEGAV